jgi:hypothetical protein
MTRSKAWTLAIAWVWSSVISLPETPTRSGTLRLVTERWLRLLTSPVSCPSACNSGGPISPTKKGWIGLSALFFLRSTAFSRCSVGGGCNLSLSCTASNFTDSRCLRLWRTTRKDIITMATTRIVAPAIAPAKMPGEIWVSDPG